MSSPASRFIRHVFVLTQEELTDLVLRKRAMLSLLLYLAVIGGVMLTLVYVEEQLRPSLGLFGGGSSGQNELLEWAQRNGFGELAQIIGELGSWPSSVVIAQLLFLLWFPTLVALVSCDMVAIDVYRGTLRFLLLRTTRIAYFVSKLLAHVTLYTLLYAISLVVLLAMSSLRDPTFNLQWYLRSMLLTALVIVPYLVFLVASTQFVSCWSSKPMNAVVRLHLMWVFFFGMVFFVPWASPLWPKIVTGLVAPVFGHQWWAVGGMLAWSGLFASLGWLLFMRRAV